MERGDRRVLLIDNHDSFTYNVAELLHRVTGVPPVVWSQDHVADTRDLARFGLLVVGPGPGRPQRPRDLGLSGLALHQRTVPVLGLCLGHQGLALLAGDEVVELADPRHGRVSRVRHGGTGVFAGVPPSVEVVRYHSLEVILRPGSPLRPTAWAEDDGCLMALEEPGARRWGVQFHPESVLSRHGDTLLRNVLAAAGVPVGAPPGLPLGAPLGAPLGGAIGGAGNGAGGDQSVAVGDVTEYQRGPADALPRQGVLRSASVAARPDTWRLHERLVAHQPTSWWLDSSAGERDGPAASDAARFSMLGDGPGPLAERLTHRVGEGTRTADGRLLPGPLLPHLAGLLTRWQVRDETDLPTPFRPGLVGTLGYGLAAQTCGPGARSDGAHPDAVLVLADRAVVVDHREGRVHAVWLCDAATEAEQRAWADHVLVVATQEAERGRAESESTTSARGPHLGDADVLAGLREHPDVYLDKVRRCRELIRAGESYEICLTTAVTWPRPVDPGRAYRILRQISPVPYGVWWRDGGRQVIGASPERFLAVDADGSVETRPIKGTRPRDPDPARDAALARDLAGSVKDRAENLMIVDLLRHDLHRVCRPGSVHVVNPFAVESYPSVHQLVSTVRGRLAPGRSALDLLAAAFPGGSMTGAPKVRTVQILDALEGVPRGVYAGAIGWLGLTGAMDTSIVIRTAVIDDGRATFGVGGAVTALSDPAEELAEILVKARSLATAFTLAERDRRRG